MTELPLTDQSAPAWTQPRFQRAFLVTLIAALLIAAAMNLIVDPFHLYGVGTFPRAEVNHYEMKIELFREFDPPAQALILGSSRVMSFDPEVVEKITGRRCFNFSVPSARTETYYAVLRLALEEESRSGQTDGVGSTRGIEAPIDTVIVAVEPEALHPTLPIEPEARFLPEYSRYFIHDPRGRASVLEKALLLFTLDQTNESISTLRRAMRKQAGRSKLEYRADGFSVQIEREEEIAAGTFDLDARIESRIRKYPERSMRLSEFKELSPTRKAYWEDFLSLCDREGIRVYAFLPPVHPSLWSLLSEIGAEPIFEKVSEYLGRTVSEHGGRFADYTRLDSFGGDPSLFYDEVHMRPSNGERLLRQLLSPDEAGGD